MAILLIIATSFFIVSIIVDAIDSHFKSKLCKITKEQNDKLLECARLDNEMIKILLSEREERKHE